MREKFYIGVDPGAKGYLCATFNGGYTYAPLADHVQLRQLLAGIVETGCEVVAVVENVHALPRQGLSSTFTFGYNAGWITGVLWGFGIPTCTVTPNKWQRAMWESRDKVTANGKVDPKKTSLAAATRLHPTFDFRRSERAKKPDDNIVDATLICDYAKRMNL